MSGTRLALASFLLVALGSSARAQEGVPGGWDEEVAVQPFRVPGVSIPSDGYGFSPWTYGGTSGYTVVTSPRRPQAGNASTSWGSYAGPPQTFNALGILGDTVQKTTRKRSRR